jgi:transposase
MKHRQFNLTNDEIRALEVAEAETREALALRRLQGVRMYGSGLDMKLIRQVTGAARRTLEDWVRAYRARGVKGLEPGWKGGNNRKLAVDIREELVAKLKQMTVAQALTEEERGSHSPFWTIKAVERVVEKWYGVRYQSRESYRGLLVEAGLSVQQPEGIYRSRPSEAVIADFEADAEKKSPTSSKTTRTG